ncbi:MAG: hypothetical protein ACUVS4_04065, partial [Chloroflexaceae bacterium]
LKPRASGLPGRPTPAHAATPVACVGGAGGFSPPGRGALHDGTSHPTARSGHGLWMVAHSFCLR